MKIDFGDEDPACKKADAFKSSKKQSLSKVNADTFEGVDKDSKKTMPDDYIKKRNEPQ